MEISVIIFDLGNVVLTNDWHIGEPGLENNFSGIFRISHEDMKWGWNSDYFL